MPRVAGYEEHLTRPEDALVEGCVAKEWDLTLRARNMPSDYAPEASDHGSLHTGESEWHWASLIDRGRRRPEMMELCPQTTKALEAVPNLCEGDMPFAFAFFSTLRPHCNIAPHYAPANLRL